MDAVDRRDVPTTAGEPRVHRPVPSATWTTTRRWGPNLGDDTEYRVTLTAGGPIEIVASNRSSVSIPAELARWLADAVAQAAAWDGEPTP